MTNLLLLLAVSAAPLPQRAISDGPVPTALECPAGAERRGAAPPEGGEEWCEAKDAVGDPRREGPARMYYDDGGLWTEERWREGRRDGPFVEHHRGGERARVGAYVRGAKDGLWTTWSPSGRLEEEAEWRAGVLHGRFVAYWPNGRRRTDGRYCGGAQCGTWRTFDEAGRELGVAEYAEQRLAP